MFRVAARGLLAASIVGGFLVLHGDPVSAGNTGGAKCGGESCDAEAIKDPEGSSGTSESPIHCGYLPLDLPPGSKMYRAEDGSEIITDGTGAWYEKVCTDPKLGEVMAYAVYLRPAELREEALSELRLPAPDVRLNPSVERPQLVNLATWLYLGSAAWRAQSATASVPGLSVTVTARPERVLWDMGNSDTVTCAGPGTPYDAARSSTQQSTDCSYTYRHSSAGQRDNTYRVTATEEWRASWTGSDGSGGDLGVLRRSSTVAVRVAESQAVNQPAES